MLEKTLASVHWNDGEGAQLTALGSEPFQKIALELGLRLCKHSASGSAEEQWLDVGSCFMVGHTLSKNQTHAWRPFSPFVKVCISGFHCK
jgi:hypothetical protein